MVKTNIKSSKGAGVNLLVATKKGLWQLHSEPTRRSWRLSGPQFLGHVVHHSVVDKRDRKTMLAAARTGHLGPTVFRSTDKGRTWHEAKQPPAFREGSGRVVDHTFWLTPGHADDPGLWYAGTSPQGLFRSEDGGDSWAPVSGFNDRPGAVKAVGGSQDGTPDGPKLHSIIVDPRDKRHLYLGMSGGGVHESTDEGATWRPLIQGLEVVAGLDPANVAFHDPHCIRLCPSRPDRLYQQNHCGIYRLDRPSDQWVRVGRAMPSEVGDVGFPMVVHPQDADRAWVFPMDGTDVWPRTCPGGVPAVYETRDAGESWERRSGGFPEGKVWWTVKRQAMTADGADKVGLYFGTTSGEVWASADEGESWNSIASHLPEIYAVEAVTA